MYMAMINAILKRSQVTWQPGDCHQTVNDPAASDQRDCYTWAGCNRSQHQTYIYITYWAMAVQSAH